MAALLRVRQAGLAVNDEELTPGLRALAAPVRDRAGGVIAAVGLGVHLSSWNASAEAITARLEGPIKRTAGEISSRLGFRERQIAD
jgi:IclR family pca regulon transcriptional regulator